MGVNQKQDWVALMSKPIALFQKFEKNIIDWKWFFFVKKKFWWKKIFGQKIVDKKRILIKKNIG